MPDLSEREYQRQRYIQGEPNYHAIPEVSYEKFWEEFNWKQDQHITIIGTTGCGKTTLELDLAPEREYVLFLGTKTEDETQEELGPLGFRIAKDVKEISLDVSHKWVLHPGGKKGKESVNEFKARVRPFYEDVLLYAYRSTGWCVIIDEGRFICDYLQLKDTVQLLFLQGRSQYNSVVMGTQRPSWVPLEAFDAATHLFFFKDNDLRNIGRISELAGLNRRAVQLAVPNLESTEEEGGQFLYYNTRTDKRMISKVEV